MNHWIYIYDLLQWALHISFIRCVSFLTSQTRIFHIAIILSNDFDHLHNLPTIFSISLCRSSVLNFINAIYGASGKRRIRMRMPWSNRESTIVPNSEKSRTLFMEAADSDKDSKSSELTIGPSCIQFRLIIVKVEKFQSAVSGHPRVISPFPRLILADRYPRESASAPFSSSASCFRIRFYEFRTVARSFREFTISVYTVYTAKGGFLVLFQQSANDPRRHVLYCFFQDGKNTFIPFALQRNIQDRF